uniref:AAA+ ATPase domain-containing protein n=1 Tax=Nannospalax galili TaxID=1026970 RepID=A0A8C6RQG2_NANGA
MAPSHSLSPPLEPLYSDIPATVHLSHLINAFQAPKNLCFCQYVSFLRTSIKIHPQHEPELNLKDLGLSELKIGQIDQLVENLLPGFYKGRRVSSQCHTLHVSVQSFFENKYGYLDMFSTLYSSSLYRQQPGTLESICSDLRYWPIFIQSRGFKTLKSRARCLQSTSERLAEAQNIAPSFMKGHLFRDRGTDLEHLDKLMKTKNIPEAHQDAFKTGFAEVCFRQPQGLILQKQNQELQEVIEFLKNPQKFTVFGGKLSKGILLVGPPGIGQKLLAQAVAGEADVPFSYASGSKFEEMFVGVGASHIRNLFREAKADAPCVLFIDKSDSVGGKRIECPMHPYSRQTINQLLAEMDGGIIIGATNFSELLDNWYLNKIKFDKSVDPEIIARGTVGFSGAEVENLVNQASLNAAELEVSKDKILIGPERRSVEIDNKNKTITAYHESGHAIIAYYTKDAMPINKATIMPRGLRVGHVSLLPENDRWNETRAQLLAQMDVSMGGRVAEELIFGGASSDFGNATKIAKRMITKFGMSEKLGVMTYSDRGKLTKYILKTHAKEHKNLAEALLTYETLDVKEIQIVLEGKKLEVR